jgi:hypothetical protein
MLRRRPGAQSPAPQDPTPRSGRHSILHLPSLGRQDRRYRAGLCSGFTFSNRYLTTKNNLFSGLSSPKSFNLIFLIFFTIINDSGKIYKGKVNMISVYRILSCIVFGLLLLVFTPCFAYAYLDPGTGSYILQIIIAALFGALFALKRYWYQVKSFLSGLFTRNKSGSKND